MNDEELAKLNYTELKEYIKVLEERAKKVREEELELIIKDIKTKIVAYSITAKDLGFSDLANLDNKTESKKSHTTLPPKYRSLDGEKTWNGRGTKPKWFTKGLAEGRDPDEFLIDKQDSDATPTPTHVDPANPSSL